MNGRRLKDSREVFGSNFCFQTSRPPARLGDLHLEGRDADRAVGEKSGIQFGVEDGANLRNQIQDAKG